MTAVAAVIGVTSRAAFLGGSGGAVIALHAASVPAFPFSWIAPRWRALGLRAGDTVSIAHDLVERDGIAVPFRRTTPATIAPSPAGARRLAATLAGLSIPDVARAATDALVAAFALIRTPVDDAAFDATLSHIVGRGPGLTPAGDDVIVGALAGFALAGPREEGRRLRRTLRAMASTLDLRTTRVSGAILLAAEEGRFAQVVADVCAAASDPSPAPLDAALCRLSRIGSSTGHDLIAGLTLAVLVAVADTGVTT